MKYGPLVTPFTAANGYSTAPLLAPGKTVDMVGGGASGELHALRRGALRQPEIVQRTNHGFASDYIGLGLDATVAQGGRVRVPQQHDVPIKVIAEYYTSGGRTT